MTWPGVPQIRRLALEPGDEFLILACDGIWDVLTNQQARPACRLCALCRACTSALAHVFRICLALIFCPDVSHSLLADIELSQ